MRGALCTALGLWIGAVAPIVAEEYVGHIVSVDDTSIDVKFQDHDHVGHHSRGRALVVADFDNDGRLDSFIGNPSDASVVLLNRETPEGFEYILGQTLFTDDDDVLAWGAQAADFDNDGDTDLFVSAGGNECTQFDFLFRNLLVETGRFELFDVTDWAGIKGRPEPGGGFSPMASANAVWADVNMDGLLDLFVNGNNSHTCDLPSDGTNLLWINNGPQPVDGRPFEQVTFTDVTDDVGLSIYGRASRHSFFFDFDLDGDLDLYEMNLNEPSVLWQNRLLEDGELSFVDVSDAMAEIADDIRYPRSSFAACPGDMNNDGWEDMVVFQRGVTDGLGFDCAIDQTDPLHGMHTPFEERGWRYPDNHAVFINRGTDVNTGEHRGFMNLAELYGVDPDEYIGMAGVMGTQLGDLNGDGILDIYIGNGGPNQGQVDQLWMSHPREPVDTPRYYDASEFINQQVDPPFVIPEAPYRTHGTVIADVDDDGMTELLVVNGGPSHMEDFVREPNHFFEFNLDAPYNFLRVRLTGDGEAINRDAIGARIAVTVSKDLDNDQRAQWTVRRTLYSGTCFSASNGLDVFFGLRNADTIEEVEVTWPDGEVTTIVDATLNQTLEVRRTP